jgi:hypothetical protein
LCRNHRRCRHGELGCHCAGRVVITSQMLFERAPPKVIKAAGEELEVVRDDVQPWGRGQCFSMQTESAEATKTMRMSRRPQEDG